MQKKHSGADFPFFTPESGHKSHPGVPPKPAPLSCRFWSSPGGQMGVVLGSPGETALLGGGLGGGQNALSLS